MGEATILAAAGNAEDLQPPAEPPAPPRRRSPHPLVLCVALLAIYVLLMFAFNLRGTVGADTGPKVATLRSMDANSTLVPDVGYWAKADDPRGRLHPLLYTIPVHGHYVAVTTLPMLLVAEPLYHLGGDRLALLVPIVGAIGCALAARAIARRLGSPSPDIAFWVVGLASPVLVYGLDLWEHTLGLCLMLCGFVCLYDTMQSAATKRAALVRAVGGGLLFGAAATMRTEALVYGAVATAVILGYELWRTRQLFDVVTRGVCVTIGLFAALGIDELVTRLLLGGLVRTARTVDAAGEAGVGARVRIREAVHSTVQMGFSHRDVLLGCVFIAVLVYAAWAATHCRSAREVWAAFVLAVVIALMRMYAGVSFVPGMLTAFPIAAAGLAVCWGRANRRVTALVALLVLPAIWYTQYTSNTDWGARYVLMSALLLGILGVVGLTGSAPKLLWAIVAMGMALNVFGVVYLAQRSRDVEAMGKRVDALESDVVISRDPFLFRYLGEQYAPSRHWLTLTSADQLRAAVAIAEHSHASTLSLVGFSPDGMHQSIPGWTETSAVQHHLELVDFFVTTYTRAT